jgi:hypothetical protein
MVWVRAYYFRHTGGRDLRNVGMLASQGHFKVIVIVAQTNRMR